MGGAYITTYGRTKREAEGLRDTEVRAARQELGLLSVRYAQSRQITVEPEDAECASERFAVALAVGEKAWIAGAHVHS